MVRNARVECDPAHILGNIVAPYRACTGKLIKDAEPHGSDQVVRAAAIREMRQNIAPRPTASKSRWLTPARPRQPINSLTPEILGMLECVHSGSPGDQHSMHYPVTLR